MNDISFKTYEPLIYLRFLTPKGLPLETKFQAGLLKFPKTLRGNPRDFFKDLWVFLRSITYQHQIQQFLDFIQIQFYTIYTILYTPLETNKSRITK